MKKRIILTLILFVVVISIQYTNIFPWWGYLLAIFPMGIFIGWRQMKIGTFLSGFVAGFLAWTLPTLYYELAFEGAMMSKIAEMMQLPYVVLLLVIGIIGGTTTGLAMYSGYLLGRGRQELTFDFEEKE